MNGSTPKLSKAQKRILKYPPSPKTWLCRVQYPVHAGEVEKRTCGAVNPGAQSSCLGCRTEKRRARAILLWPSYVAACKKVGIDPSLRKPWPYRDGSEEKQKPTRRKR